MTRDRELTEDGRKKIVRLLESGKPQNIDMALLLIEETSNTADDISKLFTKEIIIALIASRTLVTVRTGVSYRNALRHGRRLRMRLQIHSL